MHQSLSMIRSTFIMIFSLYFLIGYSSLLQGQKKYNDGPYIFDKGDSLLIQWVEGGQGYDTLITKEDADLFESDSLPNIDLKQLNYEKSDQYTFADANEIFAISDVHGQHDLMITLLQANDIIDDNLQWSFGKGHFVIVGDNFDRGDRVLDILWFLFQLQKQADKAGGRVHVLLGNHEIMVLNGDLRYLHKKYFYSSALFKTRYDQFFRQGSILGDWLSSQPIMVSINRNLFVHGGISTAFNSEGLTIAEANKLFIEKLIRKDQEEIIQDKQLHLVYTEQGPIWYRGYFDPEEVDMSELPEILSDLSQDAIIVGHTSLNAITSLHDGHVIGVDCSIKIGDKAEGLFIKNRRYYALNDKGKSRRLQGPYDKKIVSLFHYLYSKKDIPQIKITTDIHQLIKDDINEVYQPAILTINEDEMDDQVLYGRARTRGNVRKKVCRFPPLKFDFSKSYLDSLGFIKNDKLKLVFPCTNSKLSQVNLLKEYFIYGLYNIIDSNALKAKLLDISIDFEGEEKHSFTGFLVEDEKEYAFRKKAIVVEEGVIRTGALDRPSFLKMCFFQYMIANTDWAIDPQHNIEFAKLPSKKRIIALPYDYDYSGLINQPYAVPHSSLPITKVTERYFLPYKIKEGEFNSLVNHFIGLEQEIYDYCDQATYLDERARKDLKSFLSDFFRLLKRPKSLKDDIVK